MRPRRIGYELATMPRVQRLLILAGAAVAEMEQLPPSVRALLDTAQRAFVVTPPLPSRIQWLMSDTDRASHAADERLGTVLSQLRSTGVQTEGAVGDDTPFTLVQDHVRAFDPDHILIALRSAEHADWQERGLLDMVAESFRVPVTIFEIDADGRVLDRSPDPS